MKPVFHHLTSPPRLEPDRLRGPQHRPGRQDEITSVGEGRGRWGRGSPTQGRRDPRQAGGGQALPRVRSGRMAPSRPS